MKVLTIVPADEFARFEKDSLFKGNGFWRLPNIEIAKLLAIERDLEIVYIDERVEVTDFDIEAEGILIYTEFGTENRVREIASSFHRRGKLIIFFGPLSTSLGKKMKGWGDSIIIGDITLIWKDLKEDLLKSRLKAWYYAPKEPEYITPRMSAVGKKGLYKEFQPITAIIGCSCKKDSRGFCPYWLYYGENKRVRDIKEVIKEVNELPFRRTVLADDDIAFYPEYYSHLFERLSYSHKEWVVQASKRIFSYPELIKTLTSAGVRAIYIKEGWLTDLGERRLYKRQKEVQLLHSNRLLVGARIGVKKSLDFLEFYDWLYGLKLDFIEIRNLKSFEDRTHRFSVADIISPSEDFIPQDPAAGILWVKNRFYSLSSILLRGIEILPQVGLYNIIFYFLKYNLTYRQNFLEDIPYPP